MLILADWIDRFNDWLGRTVSWAVLALIVTQLVLLVLQNVFSVNRVALQESLLYLNGLVFLGGAGFTLLRDGHVRVDILYRGMAERKQAWVNIIGTLVLLWPLSALLWIAATPYVVNAWLRLEKSTDIAGIPAVFLLKSLILLMALGITLQGLSLLLRSVNALRQMKEPG